MVNDTIRQADAERLREQWFRDFLPSHLETIESLVTSKMWDALPASRSQNASFRLRYLIRDYSGHQTCFLYGKSNVAFFLESQAVKDGLCYRVVLRIPFPDRRCAMESYQSEFETLRYIEKFTDIPVTRAYSVGYSADLNSVYLLLHDAAGIRLDYLVQSWNDLNVEKRIYIENQLSSITQTLLHLKFNRIGAIISSDHEEPAFARPSSQCLENAPISREALQEVMPVARSFDREEDFYATHLTLSELIWQTQHDFMVDQVLELGYAVLQIEYRGHKLLTQAVHELLDRLSLPKEIGFRLQHPDLRAGNILVDPETFKIKAVIDWEHACVVPLSLYRLPTFNTLGREMDSDDWWERYQCTSVGLLPPDHYLHSYFSSMSKINFLLGRALTKLRPLLYSPVQIMHHLLSLHDPEQPILSGKDFENIHQKTEQVANAIAAIDRCLTEEMKHRIWYDDSTPVYRLGTDQPDNATLAQFTPLPISEE